MPTPSHANAHQPEGVKPERTRTDESLQVERTKSAEEYKTAQIPIEDQSDAVIKKASVIADLLLSAAQNRAESRLQAARETGQDVVEEDRARADRAVVTRDEFLGMVSHDIRSVISCITLSAGMLTQTASDDEAGKRVAKWATMIKDAAARVDRLVGDLVDVASIELGNLSVFPRPQNAGAVLTDIMDAFRPAALEKGISLEADPVEGEVFAMFDRDRILQVLANLVSNAIKFTTPGGTIVIQLEPSADFIRFSVRDNGAGISEDQLESIFERFWHGTQNNRRGTGLGLFISKCLIDAHGGRIWATSKLGAGSTFTFTLPAVPAPGPMVH